MPEAGTPWRQASNDTVSLRLRLTPKSSRDQVGDIINTADGTAIQAHVRAVPENGAANKAVEILIAKWLNIPKTAVRLTTGSKSRIKTLTIVGDPEDLTARLESRTARTTT
ncbi:MAG TPA: DUF167 family protein [Hyphomicrobiaceae bacterium]|nr:DUF167 family protein [Hyphomicrobiaceae bacterium]